MSADIHTLTGAYVLDALSEAERDAFEHHLSQCPECAAEVAELRETAARLGTAMSTGAPPALKSQVMAHIRSVRQVAPDGPIVPIRSRKWPLRAAGLAAAASFIAAVVLGVEAYRANRDLDSLEQKLEQAQGVEPRLVDVLTAPDARVVTSSERDLAATMVVSRSEGALAFVPQHLPSIAADRAYQLWLIDDDGAHSAGVMPRRATPMVVDLRKGTGQFGVTVEPAGGSEQPTTDPVLLLALP